MVVLVVHGENPFQRLFYPLQRAVTVRHGLLLGRVSTQPLHSAVKIGLSEMCAEGTMFYVVIPVW